MRDVSRVHLLRVALAFGTTFAACARDVDPTEPSDAADRPSIHDAADVSPDRTPPPFDCTDLAGDWSARLEGNAIVNGPVHLEVDADCMNVHGTIAWRSEEGAENRSIAGTWSTATGRLLLHDVQIDVIGTLAPGWGTCYVQYSLERTSDPSRLAGSYACNAGDDHGSVVFVRP